MDASDSATSRTPRTVPRWWFLVVFAVALAVVIYEEICLRLQIHYPDVIAALQVEGTLALQAFEGKLPGHSNWAYDVKHVALAVVSLTIYWLLIRRFLGPRVRIWIFALVVLGLPVVDISLGILFTVILYKQWFGF
jgi:hypothetical protein